MKRLVAAYYDDGIDDAKDAEIAAIAREFGAQAVGAGVATLSPRIRNIEFVADETEVDKLLAALRAAGFRAVTERTTDGR